MSFQDDAAHLTTEAQNPATVHLDSLSTMELVTLMNREDGKVVPAITGELPRIAQAIDVIVEKWQRGGRLIYLGAGTSGRLGVIDAAECPPTFSTPPERVIGIIAGGIPALTQAVEGAEDRGELAEQDLAAIHLTGRDVLVGISTSGRAAYVLRGVEIARSVGALTVGISCNSQAKLNDQVDIAITPVVGPEVISGSTRLKAGTATKIVLNMISTGVMVRSGKTFGNLMVDLKATNVKLINRARRIVHQVTGVSIEQAATLLKQSQGEVKTAIVMHCAQVNTEVARQKLAQTQGRIASVISRVQPQPDTVQKHLIIGIDGGGTSTKALLAERTENGYRILGRGEAGPSNRKAVGDHALKTALQSAVLAAFASAHLPVCKVNAACLGLAGADRKEDREILQHWAETVGLAEELLITNDAELVIAAGTPEGHGLAIIAGTGSIAYGRTRSGDTVRAGGWGYLMGDRGSAYSIAVDALQVAAIEIDTGLTLDGEEITASNAVLPLFMQYWKLDDPRHLVHRVYDQRTDRAALAQLAPLVLRAYQSGNTEPVELIEENAAHLAGDAAIVMRKLFHHTNKVPVALSGGLFKHFPSYAELVLSLLTRCRASDATPDPLGPVQIVDDPAEGAVKLAMLWLGDIPSC